MPDGPGRAAIECKAGEIINAELDLEFQSVKVKAKIKWIEDLDYPLMYIERIS